MTKYATTAALALSLLAGGGAIYGQTTRAIDRDWTRSNATGRDRSLPPSIPTFEPKIVGGEIAQPGKWPWQVALIRSSTASGREFQGQFCGGSLVKNQWVLTAAHCVHNTRPEEIDVYIGSQTLPDGSAQPGKGDRVHVVLVLEHEGYNPVTSDYDIALLGLARPAMAAFRPVVLADGAAEQQYAPVGMEAIVTGWGYINEGGPGSPKLLQAAVKIADRQICAYNYQGVDVRLAVTENMICAGLAAGGKDSCQGDSGGPLVVPTSAGYSQVGIVSWGVGCARPGLFGVYARVSRFTEWVASHALPE